MRQIQVMSKATSTGQIATRRGNWYETQNATQLRIFRIPLSFVLQQQSPTNVVHTCRRTNCSITGKSGSNQVDSSFRFTAYIDSLVEQRARHCAMQRCHMTTERVARRPHHRHTQFGGTASTLRRWRPHCPPLDARRCQVAPPARSMTVSQRNGSSELVAGE